MVGDGLFQIAEWMFIPLLVAILFVSLSHFIWSRRTYTILWVCFFTVLCIIVFYAEPSMSEDLSLHYSEMYYIRGGRGRDTPLLVWRLILTVIAHTNSNGWLPAVSMAVAGLVSLNLVQKNMESKFRGQLLLLLLLVFLGGCHVGAIVSSVRAPMAFAIWTYAYYNLYEKKLVFYWIISVLCMLIHPVVLYAIVLLELYRIYVKLEILGKAAILIALAIWPVLLNLLFKLLFGFSNAYVALLISKFSDYQDVYSLFDNLWRILVVVGGVLLFLIFCHAKTLDLDEKDRFHIGFSSLVLFFAIASCFSYQALTDRTMILVSFLALPILCQYINYAKRSRILIALTEVSYGILTCFYLNALIAHETFNGVDFYQMIWRTI